MTKFDFTTFVASSLEKIADAPYHLLAKVVLSTRFIQVFGILSLVMFGLMFHIAANAFDRHAWFTVIVFGFYAACWAMPARDMPVILQERKQDAAIADLRLKASERIAPFAYMDKDALQHYPKGHYVYVIQDVDIPGYCKIGRTNSLSRRLGRFDVVLPFHWNVVHVIVVKDEINAETFLHRRFAEKRVTGEWFALDTADIEWLRAIGSA